MIEHAVPGELRAIDGRTLDSYLPVGLESERVPGGIAYLVVPWRCPRSRIYCSRGCQKRTERRRDKLRRRECSTP
jgi:hypothetical protein